MKDNHITSEFTFHDNKSVNKKLGLQCSSSKGTLKLQAISVSMLTTIRTGMEHVRKKEHLRKFRYKSLLNSAWL